MSALIAIGAMLAQIVIWLATARFLYGRWRAIGIDRNYEVAYKPTAEKAVKDWNETDRPFVMLGALGCGFIWPVIPIAAILMRFMNGTPTLSQTEMRAAIETRDRRIAELEREAGIRP